MAKKSSNKMRDMKFVSVTFDGKERAEYDNWVEGRSLEMIDSLLEFADNNLKFSVSYEAHQEVYLVSCTIRGGSPSDPLYCYMFRHAEIGKAISIAHYYLSTVIVWGSNQAPDKSEFDW